MWNMTQESGYTVGLLDGADADVVDEELAKLHNGLLYTRD